MVQSKKTLCSVVICHHKLRLIDACLDSVKESKGVDLDVIVVTSDPTYKVPDWVRQIDCDDGPAGKRNVGAAYAKGNYIVFLDDDLTITPYTLCQLVESMNLHPRCGIGFCKIYKMDRRDIFDDCGSWLTWTGFMLSRAGNDQKDIGQYDKAEVCLSSKSATCIVDRRDFLSAGRFDPDYFILGEETDLAWRMWLMGKEAWYFPNAHSYHAFGTGIKPKAEYYTLYRIHFLGCRNYISLLVTNLGLLRLCLILPVHILAWLVSASGFALRGERARCTLILKALGWCLMNTQLLVSKRKTVQSRRQISDRVLFVKVYRNPSITYLWERLTRYLIQGLHG